MKSQCLLANFSDNKLKSMMIIELKREGLPEQLNPKLIISAEHPEVCSVLSGLY
jgi:hypothetical protein